MAEVNLHSWSEISQASEGLQLNSTAATWEHILARFTRLETRLVEHERRVAATLPPLQPEPDPPDRPSLYAAAQPPFQPINHQPCYTTGLSPTLPPLPQHPSTYWNPPIQHQQLGPTLPQFQSTSHQPRYIADQPPRSTLSSQDQYGQPARVTHQPITLQQPPRYQASYSSDVLQRNLYTGYHSEQPDYHTEKPEYQPPHQPLRSPTCWDPPGLCTQQPCPPYEQSLPRLPTYWETPDLPTTHGYPAYDQQAPTCWAPLSPQCSTPIQVRSAPCSMTKAESFLSGSILFGRFASGEEIYNSGYGSKHRMKVEEGDGIVPEESQKFVDKIIHVEANLDEASVRSFCDSQTRLHNGSATSVCETSGTFEHKSIDDGAFDANDKLIPQCTDTPDRSLDSTLLSSLMFPSLEQLQSEQVDKIKERSCPEHPVVVRQPLLRSTSPCCSALTPMVAVAVPRPPQLHPPFHSRPLFVTDNDRIWEEVPRNVVVAIGANVASINHRSTMLDTDGRLIPPRNDMSCTIMYCHKFLLTKYEEAEVVDALGEWSCPKHIGIWNCIVCITNKGIKPAGILIDVAKKIGMSSVCEVLLQGDQYLGCEKVAGVIVAHSIRKQRRENSFNGKADSNLPDDTDEKSKKAKNALFFTVDVLTLRRLCASFEHLPTFDPGGEVSPKLMFAMLFIVSWFPP